MTLDFAVTNYKIQGARFQTAVFDLQRGSKSDYMVLHKQFYFTIIQLSHLQSFQGVYLLEEIGIEDINNKTHSRLEKVVNKLNKLSDNTSSY